MRTEDVMLRLILETAKRDDNIRVVILNGSRANPEAIKDPFQDFDIVYYVNDLKCIPQDHAWLEVFGERLIMQTLDDMVFDPPPPLDGMVYLMQFTDGNRIDLTIRSIKHVFDDIQKDSLTKVLLDKDDVIKDIQPASEASYYVQKPTEAIFLSCVNEFLWVSVYVMKGLKRGHVVYAWQHLNIMRQCLRGLFDWHIGAKHDYQVAVGKLGSKYPTLLPKRWYETYLKTFSGVENNDLEESLDTLFDLFNEVAQTVSSDLGYPYSTHFSKKIKDYLLNL